MPGGYGGSGGGDGNGFLKRVKERPEASSLVATTSPPAVTSTYSFALERETKSNSALGGLQTSRRHAISTVRECLNVGATTWFELADDRQWDGTHL